MKLSFVIVVVVGLIQCQDGESKCFVQICSSNWFNKPRGCDPDPWGCGHYGAWRDGGTRKHRGLDIECRAGSRVYAPFHAEVESRSAPYPCDDYPQHCGKDYNDGILLEGTGSWAEYEVMMWYFSKDVRDGQHLLSGTAMGIMKDRAAPSPGMTNHVHVELFKDGRRVDPTPYVC